MKEAPAGSGAPTPTRLSLYEAAILESTAVMGFREGYYSAQRGDPGDECDQECCA